jgi:hypothetical protein
MPVYKQVILAVAQLCIEKIEEGADYHGVLPEISQRLLRVNIFLLLIYKG